MAEFDVTELGIVARLDEAKAIADNATDTITNELEAIVGSEGVEELELGGIDCSEIFLGTTLILRTIALVLQRICLALGGLIDGASDIITGLLDSAQSFLGQAIGAVTSLALSIEDSITSTIEGIVNTVTDRIRSFIDSIVGGLENVVRSIGDFLASIIERIDGAVRDILFGIGFAINTLIDLVGRGFGTLLLSVERVVDRIDSTVRDVGEFLVELARSTLEQMSLTVASVLGPLVGASQSVLARLGDLIASVPGALKDAGEAVVKGIGEAVGVPLGAIGDLFVTQVEAFFAAMIKDGDLSMGEVIRTLLTRLGAPADVVENIAGAADAAQPETPAFFVVALAFLAPLILAQFIGTALGPLAEQTQQTISRAVNQTLLSPADLLDGLVKGTIPDARFRDDLRQWGFSEERIDLLKTSFLSAPDLSVQIQAWLRGLIEESELDTALAENRIRPADMELLKKVVFFIPPAQDLIQMAVREVFSPEIRERFGQDEDFPEEFATFAAQQGISDEWARAYWAAHWALPSPAQGFEMLHRKVIEGEDLDVLLRALDVMPFWRDRLTQIAFSPLTRVDLRRMHALGLLTDRELQTRYEAIGFSPDDAALMVSFTVVFNSSEDELPEELVGLTRASVLNMFEDGIIARDDAVALITQMGIGADAAELYVEQRDLEISRRDRRNLIESIIALAGGGRINLSQAEDSLAQLGISAIEITQAIGRILGLIDNRDRLPSLAALEKMHKKEIIDDEIFLESIKALGFNDEWADREFALLTGQVVA